MTSFYWIKLHHQILDNAEMGFLSDYHWRKLIELMLIAGELNQGGVLPPSKQIAWRLHLSLQSCNETLHTLETAGFISRRCNALCNETLQNTGVNCNETLQCWLLNGFTDTQSPEPVEKRVSEFRKRAKSAPKSEKTVQESTESNEPVTNRYGDNRYIDTCMHGDGDLTEFKNLLVVLGLDFSGAKKLLPKFDLVRRWANAVNWLPEDWGAGLIVYKIDAGEEPPAAPEPEPEIEPVIIKREATSQTPADQAWAQIASELNTYKHLFVGSRALSLDNDVLTVAVKNETNKAFLVSRLNGQVSKTASDVIGREITVTYI